MKRKPKYEICACALGAFTVTTNPESNRASRRDYQTFKTRKEAEAWAKAQNNRSATSQ